MVEAAVELDDDALGVALPFSTARALRAPSSAGSPGLVTRVLSGLSSTSFKNKGVQALLGAVVDYLPSPLDVPQCKGWTTSQNETCASRLAKNKHRAHACFAFKIWTRPSSHTITFCPIYSVRSPRHRVITPTSNQGGAGAYRPHAADACEQPRRTQ